VAVVHGFFLKIKQTLDITQGKLMRISRRRIYFTLKRLLVLYSTIFLICGAVIALVFLIRDYPISIPYIMGVVMFSITAFACYYYAHFDVEKEEKVQQEVMDRLSVDEDDPYRRSPFIKYPFKRISKKITK
jgi:uncharacterized protein YacL